MLLGGQCAAKDFIIPIKFDKLWMQQFGKSCDKIIVKFSNCNIIEELKPLCLDFATNMTAQILLVFKTN